MATSEYVSVSSQSDTEAADLARERRELAEQPDAELAAIYVARGVEPTLARQVAEQISAKDAFAAHARNELGLSAHMVARPVQAALTSALTFAIGAAVPLLIAIFAPSAGPATTISAGSLICVAALGATGAWIGGTSIWRPTLRVTFWVAIAMGATAAVGMLVGHAV
jgi:VIT1/CCC1 family predicted Fe2+/Mn2+ transporter